MKPILIVLNGQMNTNLNDIRHHSYSEIVCADGAYSKIEDSSLQITKVLGDFDSIDHIMYPTIEYISLPNQDFTDFEKILIYFKNKNMNQFHVIGASGQEQDHFLGHLSIAKKYLNQLEIKFYDDYFEYFVTDKSLTIDGCLGKTISIVPLPIVEGLTYDGLEYPLKNDRLEFGERIGTRNKGIKDNVLITFEKGCIAIFKGK